MTDIDPQLDNQPDSWENDRLPDMDTVTDDLAFDALVPASSFDLLEGRYRTAGRIRTMNLLTAGIAAVIMFALISQFVTAKLLESRSVGSTDDARNRTRDAQQAIDELKANGAATEDGIRDYIEAKQRQVEAAAAGTVSYATLIADVSALGGQITITGITVVVPNSEETTAEEGDVEGVSVDGEDVASAGPSRNAPAAQTRTVTLTGTAGSARETGELGDALKNGKIPYLTQTKAISSNCGETCTWAWTGQIANDASSQRVEQIKEQTSLPGDSDNG